MPGAATASEDTMLAWSCFNVRMMLLGLGFTSMLPGTVGAQCPTYLMQWGSPGIDMGQFNSPDGVATDAAGDVYVADHYRIQKFTNTGTYLTQWGSYGSGSGNGQLNSPFLGVATDAAGDVYVANPGSNLIQKFTNTSTFLTPLGSSGSDNL